MLWPPSWFQSLSKQHHQIYTRKPKYEPLGEHFIFKVCWLIQLLVCILHVIYKQLQNLDQHLCASLLTLCSIDFHIESKIVHHHLLINLWMVLLTQKSLIGLLLCKHNRLFLVTSWTAYGEIFFPLNCHILHDYKAQKKCVITLYIILKVNKYIFVIESHFKCLHLLMMRFLFSNVCLQYFIINQ